MTNEKSAPYAARTYDDPPQTWGSLGLELGDGLGRESAHKRPVANLVGGVPTPRRVRFELPRLSVPPSGSVGFPSLAIGRLLGVPRRPPAHAPRRASIITPAGAPGARVPVSAAMRPVPGADAGRADRAGRVRGDCGRGLARSTGRVAVRPGPARREAVCGVICGVASVPIDADGCRSVPLDGPIRGSKKRRKPLVLEGFPAFSAEKGGLNPRDRFPRLTV